MLKNDCCIQPVGLSNIEQSWLPCASNLLKMMFSCRYEMEEDENVCEAMEGIAEEFLQNAETR